MLLMSRFRTHSRYVGVGESEQGQISVTKSEDVQLFYYFVKSERKPEEDPLLLWLTGGPGCSSFSGLVFEIGPLKFEVVEYNGSLPKLASSIIFVDSPVGTGFSYSRNDRAMRTSDSKQVGHLHQFLLKWLMDHLDFISNPVYVAGDSYSGIPVPVLAQQISNGLLAHCLARFGDDCWLGILLGKPTHRLEERVHLTRRLLDPRVESGSESNLFELLDRVPVGLLM
ncbi:Serine carboxypeptidase-like 15 [Hibiscus syriacus]|uniref:Serine carboxypeptidase-like 15 n=1 Tax=Hibiscus syriacus TaxID=106335 RepID=A0A6A3BUC2_HIBSY|nr:Serine carboxypeptidase-like 15 [Hibiscus syriacus]